MYPEAAIGFSRPLETYTWSSINRRPSWSSWSVVVFWLVGVKFYPKPKRARSRTRAHVPYLSLSVSHAQPHRRPKLKHKQKRTRTNWPLASVLFLYASFASVSCVCSRLLCARFLESLLFIEAIAASPPAPMLFRVSVGNAKMIVLL